LINFKTLALFFISISNFHSLFLFTRCDAIRVAFSVIPIL